MVVAFRGPAGWLEMNLPTLLLVWLITDLLPAGSRRGVVRKRRER
jgi:hypothetical protein